MSVYVRNLTISAHSDFSENFELTQLGGTPTNLTGFTVQSQMRKHPDSSTAHTFTVGITSAADGLLNVSLGSTDTRSLSEGRYMYDVLVSSGSTVYTLVNGSVYVYSGISSAP